MHPAYPSIFDVEPEPEATPPTPPTPPTKQRGMKTAALVLAGAVAGGVAGGVVGAHYGSDGTVSIGNGGTVVAAPVSDPKSYTAIAAKVLPSVVSIQVQANG